LSHFRRDNGRHCGEAVGLPGDPEAHLEAKPNEIMPESSILELEDPPPDAAIAADQRNPLY